MEMEDSIVRRDSKHFALALVALGVTVLSSMVAVHVYKSHVRRSKRLQARAEAVKRLPDRVRAAEDTLKGRPATRPALAPATTGNAFDEYGKLREAIARIVAEKDTSIRWLYRQLDLEEGQGDPLKQLLSGLDRKDVDPVFLRSAVDKPLLELFQEVLNKISPRSNPPRSKADLESERKDLVLKKWVVRTFEPVLDLVAAGARCSSARRWTQTDSPPFLSQDLSLFPQYALDTIEQIAIDVALYEGQDKRALQLLLTSLQFSRDLLDDPHPSFLKRGMDRVGRYVSRYVLANPGPDDLLQADLTHQRFSQFLGRLSEREKDDLESVLSGLARPLPPFYLTLMSQFASFGRAYLREYDSNVILQSTTFLTMLDALDRHAAEFPRVRLPWREMKEAVSLERMGIPGLEKELLYQMLWLEVGRDPEAQRRYALCWLRAFWKSALLAMSQDDRVPDPYGDDLQWTTRHDRTLIWSAGENGRDDGGDPQVDWLFYR